MRSCLTWSCGPTCSSTLGQIQLFLLAMQELQTKRSWNLKSTATSTETSRIPIWWQKGRRTLTWWSWKMTGKLPRPWLTCKTSSFSWTLVWSLIPTTSTPLKKWDSQKPRASKITVRKTVLIKRETVDLEWCGFGCYSCGCGDEGFWKIVGVVFVAVEVADFDKCTFGCYFFVAVEVADFDRCVFGCLTCCSCDSVDIVEVEILSFYQSHAHWKHSLWVHFYWARLYYRNPPKAMLSGNVHSVSNKLYICSW